MNVLISSAGRRGALVQIFQTTLADMVESASVVAVDRSALSAAAHLADRFEMVPAFGSSDFVPAVLEVCARNRIALLIPTHDGELGVYARHREKFRAIGTTVMVSAPETIEISADKLLTYRWLHDNGFPTVRTVRAAEALARRADWEWPAMVKPVRGYASSGVRRIENWSEVEAAGPDDLIQAMASGHEYTVDVWVDRGGRCRCAVPRRRIEIRGGEVQKAVTVRHPKLEELARELVERLPGAFGALNVQAFADGDELAVIEVNTRFGGGYPLTWRAGADFPRWALQDALGTVPGESGDVAVEWTDGLVMLRYDSAVFASAAEVGL